jgi:signal transduction histidine kinase
MFTNARPRCTLAGVGVPPYIPNARVNLTSIFEQIDDACLILDGTCRVLFANAASAKLLGRAPETLIGKPLPNDTAAGLPLSQIAREVVKTGESLSARILADGSKQWLDVRASVAGDMIVFLCSESHGPQPSAGSDDQLARSLTQLQETNRELDSVSYTISHDLRAPLRHVEAFATLLSQHLAGKLDAASAEYLGVITQSAQQMAGLLDGVLSYSRLCRRDVNLTTVSLDNAVKAVLQELKLEMEGRPVDLRLDALPGVEGDPWMVREIVAQLLRNALKFSRTRERIVIHVSATADQHDVILRIEDNGIGFNPEYSNKLFGLFQRLHNDPQFEGRGLGLAQVRRMAQRLGGRVWAEAKPDAGATFYVALPKAS